MTGDNKACCDAKTSCGDKKEDGASSCGAGKGACGTKKCLCGRTFCCCKGILVVALIGALGWFGWQSSAKNAAVCAALVAGDRVPAITAPEAALQEQVDELQEIVVEAAREQKSIAGQYIAHLQFTLASVRAAAKCN